MKVLNSFGPNPRMLRMFMLEKNINIAALEHDLMGAENRQDEYLSKNPGGQLPALELDDGSVIAETVVICDYLEELHPEPALIGGTAQERAEARMWNRRIEQKITENIYAGFRFAEGLQLFENRMRCLPEAADGLKAAGQDGLAWLDTQMQGKSFICGNRITIADLVLYCCTDFASGVGQTIDAKLQNVNGWFARVEARESAAGSLHPAAEKVGMRG
ncbi:MAG: glutathione S-transferase [Rhodospirillaceae bacterium]|nr:glutathione S-transferase [Rhodospirillaceae bacterium]|tara:strand:- start:168 stop:818 length:651 start_codon:yes stop_codon:yes gene_type:complete